MHDLRSLPRKSGNRLRSGCCTDLGLRSRCTSCYPEIRKARYWSGPFFFLSQPMYDALMREMGAGEGDRYPGFPGRPAEAG